MELIDLFLFPFYILLPLFLVFYYSVHYIKDSIERKFFYQGFLLKIFGAISAILIYVYYYKGGDTTSYFSNGEALFNYLTLYPEYIFDIFFSSTLSNFNDYNLIPFKRELYYCYSKESYFLTKISLIGSFITFRSFFMTSILCSYFSFFASWKFYKFIIQFYPELKKSLGYSVFFIPSVIFWGSGLFKDTFTLIGLYLFIIGFISIFGLKKNKYYYYFYLIIGFYLLITIRSFFILAILPFILFWSFSFYIGKINNRTLKFILFPFFILIVGGIIILLLNIISKEMKELSAENLQTRIEGFQSWHTSLNGSAYSLGEIEFTKMGIISKIPAAINVTFFRPYLWEANKPIIFISFLQSFFFLCFTIYTLVKMKFIYFFIELFKSAENLFFIGYSLFFAFIAGFTSFNFGALDRYKIPCLSTYIIGLIIIRYKYKKQFEKVNK